MRVDGYAIFVSRVSMLFLALGMLPSNIGFAQAVPTRMQEVCNYSDKPVLNVPYSAKRRFTSETKLANGTVDRAESGGSEARDSEGRAYSAGERHWTYLDGMKNVLKSEMLYRIEDPVANAETKWDTTSKVAKVIHGPPNLPNEDTNTTGCQTGCCDGLANDFGNAVEKLGVKNIQGLIAEGTRSSYTVPAGQDGVEHPIVVVHDSWYSPELKIVILETNDDPRSGTTRYELIDIVRGEPNVEKYHPPATYVLHEIEFPAASADKFAGPN